MLVNIHEAKTHFSKLIKEVLNGGDIIIAKDGKPLVRLVAYTEQTKQRKSGQFKGILQISDDFDAPLPDEILKQFYQDDE